jgi:LDH2 family malate/lactate/ureidoglycolate dehydrogenase
MLVMACLLGWACTVREGHAAWLASGIIRPKPQHSAKTMTLRYRADDLLRTAQALLTEAGLASAPAASVARTLLEGDLLGHDTHGLALLAPYLKEIEEGRMTLKGAPRVLSLKPAAMLWDGERLPGPWLMELALDELLPKAREYGVAALNIRRSHHIACLAVYLMRAADEGLLALLACSDPNAASVAPFGGTRAFITPNPIAMGFPTSTGSVLIDISASITTNGMSNRKLAAGEKFAEDWLMDGQGRPSNDPAVLAQQPPGTILPLGGLSYGHKGYGLGLMVEALTAGLSGFGRADPREGWGATVHLTVYDPDAFGGPADFLRQMDALAESCTSNPPVPGRPAVRLPGQAGLKRRAEQQASGVLLHPTIAPMLAPWCAKYRRPFPDPV